MECAGYQGSSVHPVSHHSLSIPCPIRVVRMCEVPHCAAFAHRISSIGNPKSCRIVSTGGNFDFNGQSFDSNQAIKSGAGGARTCGSGASSAQCALLSRCVSILSMTALSSMVRSDVSAITRAWPPQTRHLSTSITGRPRRAVSIRRLNGGAQPRSVPCPDGSVTVVSRTPPGRLNHGRDCLRKYCVFQLCAVRHSSTLVARSAR